MLLISRKPNESVVIDDDIVVTIVEIRGDKVRLGVRATPHRSVHRQEVFEAIRRERPAPPGAPAPAAPASAPPMPDWNVFG